MINVSLCWLQETEVQDNFSEEILNTGGYNLEFKINDGKKELVFISEVILYTHEEKT